MSATLVKEDGTGLSTANSYASAADGDAYHDKHAYASTWTAATTQNKEKALMMATRLIDQSYQFNGFKTSNDQALQWPREGAIDPDRRNIRFTPLENALGPYFENDAVPQVVIDSACELARELLAADRTAAWDGEGLKQVTVVGTVGITFDPKTAPKVLPRLVQTALSKLGNLLFPDAGTAKLIRV